MAKKKRQVPKRKPMQDTVTQLRVELPTDTYEQAKAIAKANGLSLAGYVRMAIIQRVRQDAGESKGGETK
jgi:hypothetical protein